jgi:hypothetical protein
LRLGEGLALKVGDIDATRMRVQVRDAKGNRDRFVPLAPATLRVLRRFWRTHRHPELLFPNRHCGLKGAAQASSPLDRGGVQKTLRQVVADCGLKKRSPRTACAAPACCGELLPDDIHKGAARDGQKRKGASAGAWGQRMARGAVAFCGERRERDDLLQSGRDQPGEFVSLARFARRWP